MGTTTNPMAEMFDLANRYDKTTKTKSKEEDSLARSDDGKDPSKLTFLDMLQLMIVEFQSQTIDNTADTSDMMNQLVQMSTMQAMTDMTSNIVELTQANIMSYSASLVGKEVTIGVFNEEGKLEEIVGTVTATGSYDGNQVVFIGDKSYLLSSIMAVGRLPEKKEDPEDPKDDDKVDGAGDADNTDKSDSVDGSGGAEAPDDSNTETPSGDGSNPNP